MKTLRRLLLLGPAIQLLLLSGCNYKVNKVSDSTEVPAFSREQLSYALVRQYVLNPSCTMCHGTSGGVNLESYASITAPGRLDAIRNAVFNKRSMPKAPNSALSPNQAALLDEWLAAGAPEHGSAALPPPEELKPTFASIHDILFARKCLRCHSPTGDAKKVPLDSVAQIMENPDELITPGDAEGSYLFVLVSPGARKPMPPPESGISPLDEQELRVLKEWINNGAKD